MANHWFRLYHEFSTDPKVQMLSEANQRRYIMLLCLKCCNVEVTLQDEEIAFQLRISNEEWLKTKQVFLTKNLIDSSSHPTAWDKRQFMSDSSAERVARHRKIKKQHCNVTVTPPESETDSYSDTNTEIDLGKPKSISKISKILADYGITDDLAKDFQKHRKAKKAEITVTAMEGFQREADKAGISIIEAVTISIERGWVGFKSDWHVNQAAVIRGSPQPDMKLERSIQAGLDWLNEG